MMQLKEDDSDTLEYQKLKMYNKNKSKGGQKDKVDEFSQKADYKNKQVNKN